MQNTAGSEVQYALGHSQQELERLSAQGRMLEPFTRQFLQEAGLAPGMRVLDVGCGSGEVSFLAASLVGPSGEVVGIDRAAEAVQAAQQSAQRRRLHHVSFMQGDPQTTPLQRKFDAVVGRLVLMYCPDPAGVLRSLAQCVRPGGVIAFQEFDFEGARAYPPSRIFEQCVQWMTPVFQRLGSDTRMGMKLRSVFLTAGLRAPSLRLDAAIGGGKGHIVYFVVAEVIRSLLPLIERLGIATSAEVDIDSLRDRLEAEVVESGGVITSPSLIGAWTRLDS